MNPDNVKCINCKRAKKFHGESNSACPAGRGFSSVRYFLAPSEYTRKENHLVDTEVNDYSDYPLEEWFDARQATKELVENLKANLNVMTSSELTDEVREDLLRLELIFIRQAMQQLGIK